MDGYAMPRESELKCLETRAKELSCLYDIEDILHDTHAPVSDVCGRVVHWLAHCRQELGIASARIRLNDDIFEIDGSCQGQLTCRSDIRLRNEVVGDIRASFLPTEPLLRVVTAGRDQAKFVDAIAHLLTRYLCLRDILGFMKTRMETKSADGVFGRGDWQVNVDLLRRTDKPLFLRISQKMLIHLCLMGSPQADNLRRQIVSRHFGSGEIDLTQLSYQHPHSTADIATDLAARVFDLATTYLSSEKMLELVQRWIQEDKLCSVVETLDAYRSLADISDALRRYHDSTPVQADGNSAIYRGVIVSLIRQFLSDQLEFINIAKRYIDIDDIRNTLRRVISFPQSHGKLGGKAACLFLSQRIAEKSRESKSAPASLRFPQTWFIASDMVLRVMHYNGFYEFAEQKYKSISQVHEEYSYVVQAFRNAQFPPELINGLSAALDEFGETPLIVRSSSLLEDRLGITFSGKYDSLFVANQGSKRSRLAALLDATAMVYASTFAPGPISYRAKLRLLDFSEEMGIMIQEVAGKRMGDYFLPLFTCIASTAMANEQRGIALRIVPGLKPRAFADPNDAAFVLPDGEQIQQSGELRGWLVNHFPDKIDVMNLAQDSLESLDSAAFILEHWSELLPHADNQPLTDEKCSCGATPDVARDDKRDCKRAYADLLCSCRALSDAIALVKLLERATNAAVRVQFASDGASLFLLHCKSLV